MSQAGWKLGKPARERCVTRIFFADTDQMEEDALSKRVREANQQFIGRNVTPELRKQILDQTAEVIGAFLSENQAANLELVEDPPGQFMMRVLRDRRSNG